ncbi:MAG: hypothetical protein QOI64_832 [Solirubrobacteraceae bacterium]|jgi:outer membrane murein-binding lipoprotein Lpp|nr:hypothetical protein [Solirubrobacteraceae bacterium]
MESPSHDRLTFGQLSVGLQIILIIILVGSCAGGSNNSVTNEDVSGEVQVIGEQITSLEDEVRRLRSEVRRSR